MSIDKYTGVINWTPNSAGSFGVTVLASDGISYATQSFTITVEPVARLTEIVVDPDTMDLEVEETGTFEVFAHYSIGEPQDVTLAADCVYTLPTPTAGVITVTAGEVTAVGVGTDTILISYTEGDITATATISVTVSRVRIQMEITVDIPTFKVGKPAWFTVKMIANDDSGKLAVVSLSGDTGIIDDLEIEEGSDLTFDQETFIVKDATANFRGTFDEVRTSTITIEVKTSPGGDLLCSKDITIVVEAVKVGDIYGGGVVAYIFQSGDIDYIDGETHGLITALTDQSDGIVWATADFQEIFVETFLTIGSGSANTDAIIAQHIGVDVNTYAAGLAQAYTGGDFYDWFLPSINALIEFYKNRDVIGGFAADGYWSSSEYNPANSSVAYKETFTDNGSSTYVFKSETHRVRAVRAF
ncbi:hypothetical protein ES705_31839 [subsurface metagenome]